MRPALAVIITPQAAGDLSEAWAWLRERNPRAADEWLAGIRQMILALGSFPEAHPVAPESAAFDLEIRRALYGRSTRWRVYYTVIDAKVQVLHVRHGRRGDWLP
ncbi:MAG: type II toxin-antitoxin system RelE/ParE family toxin [Paracoccus sp. (in: a-proteobacteria)]|nr:type II toxin-antitoxin system RelE/ParE family toxin [Paracoccus sp. (in: a-proteobacteria)]